MAEKLNYHEIFPDGVAEIVEDVGLPDIYLGPAYRGNGGKTAFEALDRFKKAKRAAAAAKTDPGRPANSR